MEQKKHSLKILHCPLNFAGNPGNLAKIERSIGLQSWSVTFQKSKYFFRFDEYVGSNNIVFRELKRWILLFRAIFCFDIVHFNAGHTIMPDWSMADNIQNPILRKIYLKYVSFFTLKDLWLFKKLKKGMIVTYQGDDARQKEYCLKRFHITFANEVHKNFYSPAYEEYKKWKIKKFGKYADRIYALNPDLLYVLPKRAKFLPYTHINFDKLLPVYVNNINNRSLTILHAPSDRLVKGTKYIIKAVEKLKKKGLIFNFILVENLSNKEALKLYKKADILIDQLLAGWYGGLTVELMALGKPVICYIRPEDLKFIPKEMRKDLPVINANKDTIYSVLKTYLTSKKNELSNIGKKSRKYVEKWHNPVKIASLLKKDYEKIMEKKRSQKKFLLF